MLACAVLAGTSEEARDHGELDNASVGAALAGAALVGASKHTPLLRREGEHRFSPSPLLLRHSRRQRGCAPESAAPARAVFAKNILVCFVHWPQPLKSFLQHE